MPARLPEGNKRTTDLYYYGLLMGTLSGSLSENPPKYLLRRQECSNTFSVISRYYKRAPVDLNTYCRPITCSLKANKISERLSSNENKLFEKIF